MKPRARRARCSPAFNPIRKMGLKCSRPNCKEVASGFLNTEPVCLQHFREYKRRIKRDLLRVHSEKARLRAREESQSKVKKEVVQ